MPNRRKIPSRRGCPHCVALDCIGVVTGPNGVGKSEALKFLSRKGDLLLEGTQAHYFQCVQAIGPSRAVRDVLVDLEVRQAIHQRGLALPLALKLALREFQERKISLLLLDDADLLSQDSLQGIISMYDFCRAKAHPVAGSRLPSQLSSRKSSQFRV